MAKARKGFSVHIDGREKHYAVGADVPADVVERFGWARKGLVERGSKASLGPSKESRKSKNQKTE